MFTLTPLAVALQGVGYGSLVTALQGLWETSASPRRGSGGYGFLPEPRADLRKKRRRQEEAAIFAIL